MACWRVCGGHSPLIARILCAALRPLSSLVFFPMGWDGSARRELFGVLARVWESSLDCKDFVRRFASFKQSGVLSNGGDGSARRELFGVLARVCVGHSPLIARILCAVLRPLSSLVFFPMGWDGSARRELFGVLACVWGILP
ncbi:hypothetical protein [Bartonella tribocorum]|uniref:hypothetical protein n=1 Tax=Bartonella tribocorum TaxID=85701 RepID=UPI0011AE3D2E|nr:hypothetical protein [Bartonella tribocorum]